MIDLTKDIIYEIEGQSNNVGPGDLTGCAFANIPTAPQYNVYRFTNHPSYVLTEYAQGGYQQASSPGVGTSLCNMQIYDNTTSGGIDWGFEHSTLKVLTDYLTANGYTGTLYVIKTAKGSTSIDPARTNSNWSVDTQCLTHTSWIRLRKCLSRIHSLGRQAQIFKSWCQGEADFNNYFAEKALGVPMTETTYITQFLKKHEWEKNKLGFYPFTIIMPFMGNSGKRDFNDEVWPYLVSLNKNIHIPFTYTGSLYDSWEALLASRDSTGTLVPGNILTYTTDGTHYFPIPRIVGGEIQGEFIIS